MAIEALGNSIRSNTNISNIYDKKKDSIEEQETSIDGVTQADNSESLVKNVEGSTESAKTPRYDQYIKGDAQKPAEVEQQNVAQKPAEAEDESATGKPAESKGADEPTITKTTVSTDKIEQEIKKLEKELQNLESKLQSASEEDSKSIQQQIKTLEEEIQYKSSDSYKRQNAVYS